MTGRLRWILTMGLISLPALPAEGQGPPRRGGDGPTAVDRAAAQALRMADQLELTEGSEREQEILRLLMREGIAENGDRLFPLHFTPGRRDGVHRDRPDRRCGSGRRLQ